MRQEEKIVQQWVKDQVADYLRLNFMRGDTMGIQDPYSEDDEILWTKDDWEARGSAVAEMLDEIWAMDQTHLNVYTLAGEHITIALTPYEGIDIVSDWAPCTPNRLHADIESHMDYISGTGESS